MAHLTPWLDLDMAGKLVANFLQSWLQAGLDQQPQAPQTLDDSQDPTAPSSEDGLHLSAPIDHGPSALSPGEHRQAVRLEGQSPEPGLAERPDPPAGPGLGLIPARRSTTARISRPWWPMSPWKKSVLSSLWRLPACRVPAATGTECSRFAP